MKSYKENEANFCKPEFVIPDGNYFNVILFIENEWTEELNTKKIETAKYLIQTGDFTSAKRLLERLNKRAGKTPQGLQQSYNSVLEFC